MINTEKLKTAIQEKLKVLTLREASLQSGISHPTLSRLSRGTLPDLLTYEKLCKWLNVPVSTFFSEEETEKIPCHACQGGGCFVCNGMGFYYC